MKRMILILLCLMMAVTSACAQGEYIGSMKVVNCEEWVSLRSKPDARAERLVKVPLGAIVKNCSVQSKTFTYAEYDGRCGFIASEYLIPAEAEYMALGDLRVANCSDWVNMRAEPGKESKRMAKVPLGARFENCTAAENGFVYGTYNGQQGYISADYLVSDQEYEDEKLLTNCRIALASRQQICGAVLISQSIEGNGQLARDREQLNAVLEGLADEWKALVSAIPADRIVEIAGGRELYLIIPMNEAAAVTVNELTPGTESERGRFKRVAYNSRRGDPFLLRCNASEQPWDQDAYLPEWEDVQPIFDCEVNIADNSGGGLTWYPRVNFSSGEMETQGAAGSVCDLTYDFAQ